MCNQYTRVARVSLWLTSCYGVPPAGVLALLLIVLLFPVWWKYRSWCWRSRRSETSDLEAGDVPKLAGHPPSHESTPGSKLVLVIHPGLQV
jgi:hypothetical protein